MSQQREYGDLKKRALLAKKRMKMGYWQQLMREREELMTSAGGGEVSKHMISEAQRAKFARDNNKNIKNSQAMLDEMMYQKVKEMLDKDEYTLNPIGQLMDKTTYSSLDETGKHRYVLELLNKYHELRERYYKERLNFN